MKQGNEDTMNLSDKISLLVAILALGLSIFNTLRAEARQRPKVVVRETDRDYNSDTSTLRRIHFLATSVGDGPVSIVDIELHWRDYLVRSRKMSLKGKAAFSRKGYSGPVYAMLQRGENWEFYVVRKFLATHLHEQAGARKPIKARICCVSTEGKRYYGNSVLHIVPDPTPIRTNPLGEAIED